jgi:hypothetical protein
MITTWSTSGLSDTALAAFAFIISSLEKAWALRESTLSHRGLLIVKNSAEWTGGVSPCQAKDLGKNAATYAVITIYDAPY